MAKKPTKDTSDNSTDDKDMVRKIWLAGIGAYGRAFSEAKGAVDSLTGKSSAVFDELVQKGQVLEAVGKYKAEELIGKGKSAVDEIKPDLDIDDRIAKMRARLSGKAQSTSTKAKSTSAKKTSKVKTVKTPSKKKMTTTRTVPSSKKTK